MVENLSIYVQATRCPLQCEGITNDQRNGHIPRSFYWGQGDCDVSLLVVSKNPAHAPEWESQVYERTPPEQLAQVHWAISHDLFHGVKSVSSQYHVNLVRRVSAVLGVEASAAAVFKRAAMTALAKCQSSGFKTAKIPDRTFATCAERYLFREIEQFRPVYLVALGNEPYAYLTQPSVARRHGLKVGKLWHPSWSNMPGGEAAYFHDELPRLHAEYRECLRVAGRAGT
jgi:DNA polymerase